MAKYNPRKQLAILERRRNIATRYLHGQSQWEIARAFELTQATISRDLKFLHQEWLKESVKDRGEQIARQLARVDEIERNAWTAWTKSQENAETQRDKTRGDATEKVKIVRGQAGDPRFLEIMLKCVQRRCELLGLDAPKVVRQEQSVREIFDQLLQDGERENPIQRKLAEAEGDGQAHSA